MSSEARPMRGMEMGDLCALGGKADAYAARSRCQDAYLLTGVLAGPVALKITQNVYRTRMC